MRRRCGHLLRDVGVFVFAAQPRSAALVTRLLTRGAALSKREQQGLLPPEALPCQTDTAWFTSGLRRYPVRHSKVYFRPEAFPCQTYTAWFTSGLRHYPDKHTARFTSGLRNYPVKTENSKGYFRPEASP